VKGGVSSVNYCWALIGIGHIVAPAPRIFAFVLLLSVVVHFLCCFFIAHCAWGRDSLILNLAL
jgi:hypothetical protein